MGHIIDAQLAQGKYIVEQTKGTSPYLALQLIVATPIYRTPTHSLTFVGL